MIELQGWDGVRYSEMQLIVSRHWVLPLTVCSYLHRGFLNLRVVVVRMNIIVEHTCCILLFQGTILREYAVQERKAREMLNTRDSEHAVYDWNTNSNVIVSADHVPPNMKCKRVNKSHNKERTLEDKAGSTDTWSEESSVVIQRFCSIRSRY